MQAPSNPCLSAKWRVAEEYGQPKAETVYIITGPLSYGPGLPEMCCIVLRDVPRVLADHIISLHNRRIAFDNERKKQEPDGSITRIGGTMQRSVFDGL